MDIKKYFAAALEANASDLHLVSGNKPTIRVKGVLEIVDDFDGDTYRSVYTVKFRDGVYVLHVFQKKSKRGAEVASIGV